MTDDSPDGAEGALFPEPATGRAIAPRGTAGDGGVKPAYRVLARKYRPRDFSELIGQDVMVRILTNAFAMGRVHQAYMLTGVRGVGKTTTARILARALNYQIAPSQGRPGVDRPTVDMPELGEHCQAIMESRHVDVIEMDAASHTGVDDVREIIEGARYKPAVARTKVYIIDEVHMLSKSAFNALLKTLEEPPDHVKFIFATTEIEKVPVTVRSRCLRFDLRRVETPTLVDHLGRICAAEGVRIAPEGLSLVARAAEGSVRDSLSLLDQALAQGGGGEGELPAASVRAMLGLADKTRIVELFESCMAGDTPRALALLQAQYDEGADPAQVLLEVAEFVHLTTRAKIAPDAAMAAPLAEEAAAARRNAAALSIAALNRAWQILIKGVTETRESARPLAAADMVLVRLAYAADLPTPDDALRQLGFGAPAERANAPHGERETGAPRGPDRSSERAASSETTPIVGAPVSGARSARGGAAAQPAPRPDEGARSLLRGDARARSAPLALFDRFEDVVARAAAERDIQLKHLLERDVRLVRFERGQVEFSLSPGGSAQLPQILMRRLQEWTGERWLVALSTREGAPSLWEQAEEKTRARERGVEADPLVRATLERFAGARIVDVRMPEGTIDEEVDTLYDGAEDADD